MRKIILPLVAFALIAIVASAGCVYHEITLDPNLEPYSTETIFIYELEVYTYDDFILNEFLVRSLRLMDYELEFNEGIVSPEDWESRTNQMIYDIMDYHDAKYPNTIEINTIAIRQESDEGLYSTIWDSDNPDMLRFITPSS